MPAAPRLMTLSRRCIIGSIVVALIALTCVRLGIWQLHRLEQKRNPNAGAHVRMRLAPVALSSLMLDSAGLLYRRATLTGKYDDAHTIIVAGRALHGVPGVHVLTPMRVGNSGVLVNRGWVGSSDAASIDLEAIRESAPAQVQGLILALPENPRRADDSTGFRRVWYHLSVPALRRQFPYPLAGYVVQILPSADAPAAPKRLPPPELDEGPHLGYAIQWFGFAAIGVIGWLILLLRGYCKPPSTE